MSDLLHAALAMRNRGFWPVAIHARGEIIKNRHGEKTSEGKNPVGFGWGLERWGEARLHHELGRYPQRGLGVCFGPGRGPGGTWLIDLEGDGEGAGQSLERLLGGQIPTTPSWVSRRGDHTIFTADGERLLKLLATTGATERKGSAGAGVWHMPEFPGLEWRIGGFKPDGTVKQVQSVVPPSTGTDGTPRRWKVGPENPVMELPSSAYEVLERLAKRPAIEPVATSGHRRLEALQTAVAKARDAYTASAMAAECRAVENEPRGNRNNRLNVAAFVLGQLVGAGALSRSEVEQALMDSARERGCRRPNRPPRSGAASRPEKSSQETCPPSARSPIRRRAVGAHPRGPWLTPRRRPPARNRHLRGGAPKRR